MSVHVYQPKALLGDYIRSGIGSAISLMLLVLALPNLFFIIVFGGLSVFCLMFGARTWQRQRMRVELTEEGISTAGSIPPAPRVAIGWHELSALKLKFYSLRRDRTQGWMEMQLTGGQDRLRLDSNLEDFEAVARRAARAALDNRLPLDPATAGNLGAIGIVVPGDSPVVRHSGPAQ